MGKKTKKTRWRTLSIDLGPSSNGHDKNHNYTHHREENSKLSPTPVSTETKVYFNEDEYTKITTPRQDVLFKKGYFARRMHQLAAANLISSDPGLTSGYELPNGDYLEEDYINDEYDGQGFYNSAPYMDPSTPMYYNYGNNSYEVYDPYTGSMTVLMGGPSQYAPSSGGQPLLPPMSGPPMSVDWYNQQPPYYPSSKHQYDSSHAYTSPESLCPPTSPQDVYDDPTLYPQSFIYPGYMLSNNYHTTGNGGIPVLTSPPQTFSCDSSSFKKRKRRKKRKKEGATEEEYESSSEDQCSQSGASEQLDSKTTSDSGVHTHNSGESTPVTPPLSISFYPQTSCHPIPAFTSTDEDSTTSMPYYNPYHHMNYNYTSDTLAPMTSVIDPHYVMHKSKKLKGKRPKADLNKFFPSASQNASPCSYHSRDLSVPSTQPPQKQLTILKPEMPRKFPPTQIRILKSNSTAGFQNESLAICQKIDSQSTSTSQVMAKVSEDNHSTVNNAATENGTTDINLTTNCSNNLIEQTGLTETVANRSNQSFDDRPQTTQDLPAAILNSSVQLSNINVIKNEICLQKNLIEIRNGNIEKNNITKKPATEETVLLTKNSTKIKVMEEVRQNTRTNEKEDGQNQEKLQLHDKTKNEIKEKTDMKEQKVKLTNGHLYEPEDKCFNRTPSHSAKNIMTNGFHQNEIIKPIENGFGKVKQKQKTKKSKTNPMNTSQVNNCDNNKTVEETEVNKNVQNGHVTPTNEKQKFIFEIKKTPISMSNEMNRIANEESSKKIMTNIEDKSISDSGEKVEKRLQKNSKVPLEGFQNGIVDNTFEDNFETCSNKSEELEELYIKNNPLLAKLVDMESLNNNEQDIKDKNTIIALSNQLFAQDKENIPNGHNYAKNEKEDIISEVYNKSTSVLSANSDIQIDTENVTTEHNSLKVKVDEILKNCFAEEIELMKTEKLPNGQETEVETKDTNTRLNESKEDKINKNIEPSKSDSIIKKKSDKKKKSKEEHKTQLLANRNNDQTKVKEKSPELSVSDKLWTKESPVKEICTEKKSNELDDKVLEKQTQNKSEKKNKSIVKCEEQMISKERIRPEKEARSKERTSPEKQEISIERKLQEKQTISKERKLPEKQAISKDRKSPEKQAISKERTSPEKQENSKERKLPEKQAISKERTSPEQQAISKERTSPEQQAISKERRISPSAEKNAKRKNSKKKQSPPPIKSNKKDTAIDTAQSFIDDMLSEAVNKVKMKLESIENVTKTDKKQETANVITPDIPLQAKITPILEMETKSHTKQKIDKKEIKEAKETKTRKLSRQNSNKSIKSQGKSKTKTPERRPSEVQAAPPVLHITDVVTKWLQEEHGGKLPVDYLEDDDDEVFVQPNLKTGSKNWKSNPSPASFPKGTAGDRVADRTSDISDRCNAKDCVSKYYNLGIRTSPENEVMCPANAKDDKQFNYPAGPLPPCGICCMIQ